MENTLYIEIPKVNRKLEMPLTIAGCSKKQYIDFMEVFQLFEKQKISYIDFRIAAVYALLDLKKGNSNLKKEEKTKYTTSIFSLSEYIDQYLKINSDTGFVKLKLQYVKNHIQSVIYKSITYYGPQDFFVNTTFGEYEDAIDVLMAYERNSEKKFLIRLFSIFYREKQGHKKGIHRSKYKPDAIEQTIHLFQDLPLGILYGFYYTLASFHNYFTSSSVIREGRPIDMSIIFTLQDNDLQDIYESPYPSLGLKSIAYQISESGVFGTYKELREYNLWEVAFRLYDSRKRDLDNRAKDKLNNSSK